MQVNLDAVFTHHAQRALMQTHLAARNFHASTLARLRDIDRTDRSEQLAFGTDARRNRDTGPSARQIKLACP